jgi:hypothetical protein
MKKVIRLSESDLARIVKRVISEQEAVDSEEQNWLKTLSGLKTFNNPKVINFKYGGKPITSLNWGKHSDAGKNKNWGLSVSSDGSITFQTSDQIQSKLFENKMGVKNNYNNLSKNYSYKGDVDFSSPQNIISKIKSVITILG